MRFNKKLAMRYLLIIVLLYTLQANLFGQATANSDGNWSNTGTWQGGNIGDGGESVTLNANVDIIIQNAETFTI